MSLGRFLVWTAGLTLLIVAMGVGAARLIASRETVEPRVLPGPLTIGSVAAPPELGRAPALPALAAPAIHRPGQGDGAQGAGGVAPTPAGSAGGAAPPPSPWQGTTGGSAEHTPTPDWNTWVGG